MEEESEALYSRVGIMMGGKLVCLASFSLQHLKTKYGIGYHFEMKLCTYTYDVYIYINFNVSLYLA